MKIEIKHPEPKPGSYPRLVTDKEGNILWVNQNGYSTIIHCVDGEFPVNHQAQFDLSGYTDFDGTVTLSND